MDYKEILLQLLLEKSVESKESKPEYLKSEYIGKTCMVRTYSAGVFYGEIVAKQGKEVRMTNARRVYRWSGAATLSQLATDGTSNPKDCKFPCSVASVELVEAIEIVPMTEKAIISLNEVAIWRL